MISKERSGLLTATKPYVQVALGFIYKEKDAHIIPIVSLGAPFKLSLWIMMLGILSCSILVILMIKQLTQKWKYFYDPILSSWATVLGRSYIKRHILNGRSIESLTRIIIIHWILFWFIIRSSYEGALYNYLQGYRSPSPYDTVEKVLASDCKVISGTSIHWLTKHIIHQRER